MVQRATLDDCDGQLICINGKCSDNPDVGTHICAKPGRTPSGQCQSSGTLRCNGKSFPQFKCSPTVTSSTKAKLTNNDFSEGGDGGGPSECDGKFHDNSEPVVALSTGWYDGGSRCGKKINIRASAMTKVVDECDSVNGCDEEHANQPPCKNDIVDALGLNIEVGVVDVTWSMA
ncbi:hypothetical protein Pint_32122 [Pistacia integerrima]|uniref:Uncharacterized protein n=1 Tax=Pistacia integerrima TaxID=434235 RepID=A0ACC0XQ51_9ROSI|nr:hypothetical protein Pint_32122 [Pistacia integerrima]